MSCKHLIRPACGCPQDAALPESVPAPVEPEPPKKKKRSRGNQSPWAKLSAERNPPPKPKSDILERIAAVVSSGQAQKLLDTLTGNLAKLSFSEYCRAAWHVVETSTRLDWGSHHDLLCTVLQALFEDWLLTKSDPAHLPAVLNTCINCPPGTLKSRILSVFFPTWCWLRAPGMKFICLSVNEAAAFRDARAGRDLIKSDWYQSTFTPSWTLKGDQDAISNYGNTLGGERLSQASGSEIVGLRGDCLAYRTPVLTEIGSIDIGELHDRAKRGVALPRVVSFNHLTGQTELCEIVATRRIKNRPTIDVRVGGIIIKSTHAHRFFSEGSYAPAASISGRNVSVLRGSVNAVSNENSAAMSEVPLRQTDVRYVPDAVRATRIRVRQARQERSDGGSVLFQDVQDEAHATSGCDSVVRRMSEGVPSQIPDQEISVELLEQVQGGALGVQSEVLHHDLREVQDPVLVEQTAPLLHSRLRVSRQNSSSDHERSVRCVLEGTRSPNQATRQLDVRGVWDTAGIGTQRVPGTPRGPRPDREPAREPSDALRDLPHDSPQVWVEYDPVLLDHVATVVDRGESHDVYDLQVEKCHNFFAGGVLVHNCLIIDDANNPLDAGNKNERDKVNALWNDNQFNRVNDPIRSMRIGIQQRTHADDWTGNVISKLGLWSAENRNGWLNVVLPAEYEESRPAFELPEKLKARVANLPNIVTKDWRSKQGETLHPKRMTPEFIAGEKRRWAGTGSYAGQMQQRPASETGGKIQRAWLGWFRLSKGVKPEFDEEDKGWPRPFGCDEKETVVIHEGHHRPGRWDFDQIVISCDPAVKKTEAGSLWGMLAIGYRGARRYVLDDRSDRREPHEAVQTLKEMVRYWRPDRLLIEEKAGGSGLIDSIKLAMIDREVPMVAIEAVNPGTQDKELRLNAASATIANGLLFILDGAPWAEAVVTELCDFPAAPTDDRLDCITQCINHDLPSGYELPATTDGVSPWAAAGL